MREKRRKRLSGKVTAICGAFVLIISFTLGLLGFFTYYDNIVERYEQYVEAMIRIAGSHIDVEDMAECIRTGEKSEAYDRTQEQLDRIKSQSNVEYLYVIQPLNTQETDNARYIWNAVTAEELEEFSDIASLGDLSGEGFSGEMAEVFEKALQEEDQVTYYSNNTSEFGFVLTGMLPLKSRDGETQVLVCVDILMNEINEDVRQYILFVLCGTLIVGTLFLLLLLRMVNRSVVAPVVRMADSAEDFVRQSNEGTEPSQLSFRDPCVSTGDEVQLLSESLKEMTLKLVSYMKNLNAATADKERFAAEMNVAQNIQAGMLPSKFPAFPERTEFDIYAALQVAGNMSGNFYDFFLVDKNHLALVIGDINGTGIPAALLMVITRTLIKNYARLGFEPEKVFVETNNQFSESNEGMTTAAFLGILNLSTGVFSYVNGGHRVPLLKHAGGEFEPLPTKDCFVLGSMAGVPYWQQSVQLTQGDLLFFYTKGLTDAENEEKMQYSEEHMQQRLNQTLSQVYELKDILKLMQEDVQEFLGGARQGQEDMTMLILRYFGM